MGLRIKESWVVEFIRDPVMAAEVIMGAKLDVFQRSRLRFMWFCARMIDNSGVSTAKSEVLFIWACLRAILITNPLPAPGRIVSVYYQTLDTAREVFWNKFEKYRESAPLFEAQLKPLRGGKYGRQLEGCLEMPFRNRNRIQCPAGDFVNDAKNQASRRFNDLAVDEAPEIDKMGKGINKQLLQRSTAQTFNKEHPVWANHQVLLGHAEDPYTHPFYKRVKQFRRLITDGSVRHVVFTSTCWDYTGDFARRFRPEEEIKEQRTILTEAEFGQVWLGVWMHGSVDWYGGASLAQCADGRYGPVLARQGEDAHYALGWDTAPGMSRKADLNSGTVWSVRQVQPGAGSKQGLMEWEGAWFEVRPVCAVILHGKSVDELAGVVHWLHLLFHLSIIVMDPGGGGAWVYKKMREGRQLIQGEWRDVVGLCSLEDASAYQGASPLVAFFKRREEMLEGLIEERFMLSDEGPVEWAHTQFSEAFDREELVWPKPLEERTTVEIEALSPAERQALAVLDEVLRQVGTVKVLCGSDGQPKLTARKFRKFVCTGKKDAAYGALYGFVGALRLVRGENGIASERDEAGAAVGYTS